MRISLRYLSHRLSLAVGLMAVLASGCTVQEQPTPDLAGPSELGLSLSVVAQPEILPRDGSSMSSIIITAFDSNGKPKPNQQLILTADAGTLNAVERTHIEQVLRESRWRINGTGNAAERLGLHPNTLRFRMKKLGIVRDRSSRPDVGHDVAS